MRIPSKLLLFLFLFLAVLGAFAGFAHAECMYVEKSKLGWFMATTKEICTGMSKSEIYDLLGEPKHKKDTVWVYKGGVEWFTLYFSGTRLVDLKREKR